MIKISKSELERQILAKRLAYSRVFTPENQFTEEVLRDLARFCCAHRTAWHADARIHALNEGRREVWLEIQMYLNLSVDEIYKLRVVSEVKEITNG